MPKKIAPLDFYQNQFNDSWYKLYKALTEDMDPPEDPEEATHQKIMMDYLDNLGQLLDELVFAVKPKVKKTKKHKKTKK